MRKYTYVDYTVGHMPNSDLRKIRLLPEIREPNYYVTRGVCKLAVEMSTGMPLYVIEACTVLPRNLHSLCVNC